MKAVFLALALLSSSAFARTDTDQDYSRVKLFSERLDVNYISCSIGRDTGSEGVLSATKDVGYWGVKAKLNSRHNIDFDVCISLQKQIAAAIHCHGSAKVTVNVSGLQEHVIVAFDPSTIDYGEGSCL